jgi:hemerythrin-like domain-containing protein
MTNSAALSDLLHQEHLHTLAVLNDMEDLVSDTRARPLDVNDRHDRSRLKAFMGMIEQDILKHYRFEEDVLFPRLDEVGLAPITQMLAQEHDAVRSMTDALQSTAEAAFDGGFDATTWKDFRDGVMDLVYSVSFHIQKEEMGVIRQLAAALGDDADVELGRRYLASA